MVHCKLTGSKKGIVVGLLSFGTQKLKIAMKMGYSCLTELLKRLLTRYRTNNAQRHNALSSQQEDSFTQIQATCNTRDKSRHGFRLLFYAHNGIRKWHAATKVYLMPNNAQKHKEREKIYKHWTEEDWRSVVWSDECCVARSKCAEPVAD